MANASTKSTTSAEHRRPAEELERARTSTMEHLQQASAEISASLGIQTAHSNGCARSAASCAGARRIRPPSGKTPSNRRPRRSGREMGRRAIRAQRTPEALQELSAEMHKREADLVDQPRVPAQTVERRSSAGGTGCPSTTNLRG